MLGFGLLVAGVARAQRPDSSWVRLEVGALSDVTNERYYEDGFDDTTFTGRRLAGSPEYRNAGLLALDWATALPVGSSLRVRQEAVAGDHLLRSYTRAEFQGEPREGWKAQFVPELDLRRDRSFGADRREFRFRPEARVRATSLARDDMWELLVGGDWSRYSGSSDVLTLDRNAGRGQLRWTHTPLDAAWELELGYGADLRTFPDSVIRDHVEQHASATLRHLLPGAGSGVLDLQLDRRSPLGSPRSTRDRFWSPRAELSAFVPVREHVTLEWSSSLDGYHYAAPDTSVYFDYQTILLRPGVRWTLPRDWSLRAGPRFEWLRAPRVPTERYLEQAIVLEVERLHGRDWWSFQPIVGQRRYERSTSSVSLDNPDLHSSYRFIEGELFADLGLPAGLRLRITGSGRLERHEDSSQDASSVYFALDLRRSF